MTTVQALVLGIIQGITEFLPISSSGHLVLAQHLFSLKDDNLLFDTIVHAGTALSILVVFRRDITTLIGQLFSRQQTERMAGGHVVLTLVIGTIPAAVAGILFKDFFESLFSTPRTVGYTLLVTALLLFFSAKNRTTLKRVTLLTAVIIGCAQALAIVPGISRSGSTIAVALLIGINRDEAGRFSFLLALPAILGAMVLQMPDISESNLSIVVGLTGFIVSFLTGLASCIALLHFVKKGKLHYFGFYCVAAGAATLIFIQ